MSPGAVPGAVVQFRSLTKKKGANPFKMPPNYDRPVSRATFEFWDRFDRTLWGIDTGRIPAKYEADEGMGGTRYVVEELDNAVLISSERPDGMHAITLDIDHPAALYPSSSLGHYHLYIDVALPWWRYKILLRALAWAGVIEKGYRDASFHKRGSFLRLPWVSKWSSE